MSIASFFLHRHTFLLLALLLGLLLGERANVLQPFAPYILSLVLGLSIIDFDVSQVRSTRTMLRLAFFSLLLNFLLLGGLMVLLYKIMYDVEEILFGFLLLAISPPGPSVVPFTLLLRGNTTIALIGFVLLHLVTILLLPLLLFFYNYQNQFSQPVLFLFKIVLLSIIIPYVLSRIFRHEQIRDKILPWRGKLVNAGFFLIIVPIVGQSVTVIRLYPEYIWQSTFIFFIVMGVMPFILNVFMKFIGVQKSDRTAYIFLSTTKSSAFAAVITFSLGAVASSVPVAIHAFFVTFFFIGYSMLRRKLSEN